ncbi:MAG TPA: hypothetical protein VKI61_07125 [Chitinophagaceae bacterium]|jgi:hypothetical protein|nr:hypothetical protein [Chitinophagaceae bacterium]
MNWRTILGLVLILVGVLQFMGANNLYHSGWFKSYPLTAYLTSCCPIIVGSLLMNKGRKKKNY